jgi:hypothetical protein
MQRSTRRAGRRHRGALLTPLSVIAGVALWLAAPVLAAVALRASRPRFAVRRSWRAAIARMASSAPSSAAATASAPGAIGPGWRRSAPSVHRPAASATRECQKAS